MASDKSGREKRQSFKAIYPEVLRKTEPYLMERYAPVLRSKMSDVGARASEGDLVVLATRN